MSRWNIYIPALPDVVRELLKATAAATRDQRGTESMRRVGPLRGPRGARPLPGLSPCSLLQVLRDELKTWKPALSDRFMMGRDLWANYVYCGLLYVVIEGMTKRGVQYRGSLAKDIRRMRQPLNKARDATFHVGESYWDPRLFQLLEKADAQAMVRVHAALGQLLRAELARRPLDTELRGLLGLDDTD